jgi:hypothetical protein
LLCGLSADEYNLFTGASAEMQGFFKNELIANASFNIGTEYWNAIYDHLYSVNSAIEGLNNANGLTESVKQQLLGEAKFMRAFFYFYLVNLYDDVPLVISTDYTINAAMARTAANDVYEQIKKDLKEAQVLLSNDYLDGKLQEYSGMAERVRPTKWAATALLARVYLYAKDWPNAEIQSTAVINNTTLYDTMPLNDAFRKNTKEAIWQLQPVKSNQNTDDSKMFIITTGFSNSTPVRLSDTLLNSFEQGDLRAKQKNWVDTIRIPKVTGPLYFFPFKYKNNTANVTEYLMVLRISEQYLIRAEARANGAGSGISGSITDINKIRIRAGLPLYNGANDMSSVLKAIYHERQVELFSEWGHRWFDLKRTGNANSIMNVITPKKGGTWESTDQLYPIPFRELQRGINLTQNLGYE